MAMEWKYGMEIVDPSTVPTPPRTVSRSRFPVFGISMSTNKAALSRRPVTYNWFFFLFDELVVGRRLTSSPKQYGVQLRV